MEKSGKVKLSFYKVHYGGTESMEERKKVTRTE